MTNWTPHECRFGPDDDPGRYYGGFSKEQRDKLPWRVIHHPIYDPEPTQKQPSVWATFLAAVMALFTTP